MKKALTLLIAIILIMYGIPGTAESSSSAFGSTAGR